MAPIKCSRRIFFWDPRRPHLDRSVDRGHRGAASAALRINTRRNDATTVEPTTATTTPTTTTTTTTTRRARGWRRMRRRGNASLLQQQRQYQPPETELGNERGGGGGAGEMRVPRRTKVESAEDGLELGRLCKYRRSSHVDH